MQNEDELLNDKMFSLVKVWAGLLHSGLVDGSIFSFNHAIATKVVTHYFKRFENSKNQIWYKR